VREAQRLIERFRAQPAASARTKLDTLLALEVVRDPRIVPFLTEVLVDRREPTPVRMRALKRLRNGNPIPAYRPAIALAILGVLSDQSNADLRVQAALALAVFIDIEGVVSALGNLALKDDEPLDLRYSAFTSLQRAGPAPECVALLRQLLPDEALGRSARSVLTSWRLETGNRGCV
jgi:HEAT repeat protein